LHAAALVVVLLVVVSGSAIAVVDSGDVHSVQDGIWWALVTVTTSATAMSSRTRPLVGEQQPL
jgi:hypothetical protein